MDINHSMTRTLASAPLLALLAVVLVIAAAVTLVALGVEAGSALAPVVQQLREARP